MNDRGKVFPYPESPVRVVKQFQGLPAARAHHHGVVHIGRGGLAHVLRDAPRVVGIYHIGGDEEGISVVSRPFLLPDAESPRGGKEVIIIPAEA